MKADVLLAIARGTLEEACADGRPVRMPEHEPWLCEKRAVFVTLHKHGQLRGCVGQLEPRLTLFEAVRQAARSAALHDSRFSPVGADELGDLQVEISVLSPLEDVPAPDEATALAAISAGTHGVVLSHGFRSGTFIPEVWKEVPDKQDFFRHLKRKAGLPTDRWLPGTKVQRFTAQLFAEGHP